MNNIIDYRISNSNNSNNLNNNNNLNIDNLNSKYKYVKYLGNQDFNSSIHILKNNQNKKMLCKIIDLNNINNKKEFNNNLNNELKFYNYLNNKLVKNDILLDFLYKEKYNNLLYLFSKYKKFSTLREYQENINKTNVNLLIKKILYSINKLHKLNIAHQNINEDNILIIPKNKTYKINFINISDKNHNEINIKKDIKDLGLIFVKLLDQFIEDAFFTNMFNYNKKIKIYNKILDENMIKNSNDCDLILKTLIHYDKYKD